MNETEGLNPQLAMAVHSRTGTKQTQRQALSAAALSAALLAATHANAASLAEYRFTNGSLQSTDRDTMSVASNLRIRGFASGKVTPLPASLRIIDTDSRFSSFGGFLAFRVSPRPGFELDLTRLTFDYQDLGGLNSTIWDGGPLIFAVVAITGGNSIPLVDYMDRPFPRSASFTLSLDGPAFQRLTSPITFRIHFGPETSGTSGLKLDNVVLRGSSTLTSRIAWNFGQSPAGASLSTANVPEPATAGLLGLGSVALLSARRRLR